MMATLDLLLVGVFGLIIGSFLNVVICRYNTGRGVVAGRSVCLQCSTELGWRELVPLFSFMLQGGRCAHCGCKISWQYPAVELVTALLFVGVWQLNAGWPLAILYWTFWSLAVVIAVYDLHHKIIPNGPVYGMAALALVDIVLYRPAVLVPHLLAGAGLFIFFWLLWRLSGGRWMGLGDAKLALPIGWLLGPAGGVSAIVFAFWIGAVIGVGLVLLAHKRRVTMKSEIPFAPFMLLGLLLNFFFAFNVIPF